VPGYFLDTSALAKLYHQEAGSQYLEWALAQPGLLVVVSRLSLVEIESVMAIKVRIGELDVASQELFRRRFRADISQQRIVLGPQIDERHYRSARRLLLRHGVAMALRTLDAIQLSVALDLHEAGLISLLVAADQKLCRVAETCGCPTLNPIDPEIVLPGN